MDRVIELIRLTVNELLQYRMVTFEQYANEMVNVMFDVFPQIIAVYADDRLSDVSGDASYWPSQLERIIKVLEGGDDFAAVDVLYSETLPNLIELRDILTERGII